MFVNTIFIVKPLSPVRILEHKKSHILSIVFVIFVFHPPDLSIRQHEI